MKERDINYEFDMMNKPTRLLQEEKIREECKRKKNYVIYKVGEIAMAGMYV
jgi:hypothetical protein